jgi:hypothetical protein
VQYHPGRTNMEIMENETAKSNKVNSMRWLEEGEVSLSVLFEVLPTSAFSNCVRCFSLVSQFTHIMHA